LTAIFDPEPYREVAMTTSAMSQAGLQSNTRASEGLLVCGLLSSIWYAAMNVVVPHWWTAYSSAGQTISELSAIDAPTRLLWGVLAIPYTLLVTAFAWGVVRSAGPFRGLRTTGLMILAFGALGLVWPFAPMHLREALANGGGSASDTMHLSLGVISVLLMLLAISNASIALGRRFAVYSIGTLVVVLAFGVLTGIDAPKLQANRPTPFIGVWERISVGGFLLWIAALSVRLRWSRPGPHVVQAS
jgi:hypothetical protein